jgi:hypothetical protein
MTDALARIWEEAAAAKIEVLSRNVPRGAEENHEKSQSR